MPPIAGDQKHGLQGCDGFDCGCQFVSRHPGHRVIGDDQIESGFVKKGQRLLPIGGNFNTVPVGLQYTPNQIADERLVIHEQNAPWQKGRL